GSGPVLFAKTAVTTTAITTLVWAVVTLITGPESEARLVEFYRKVRPDVRGWRPVAKLVPEVSPTLDLGRNLLAWLLGCAMVYLALFGIGRFVLGARGHGLVLVLGSGACALALRANLRRGWSAEAGRVVENFPR
ncbi:MAG TPA: hypothetical protein VEK84_11450, partial [Terriglobales bacterium]|nr:hypothetical protein [Terriglobales bacterium]